MNRTAKLVVALVSVLAIVLGTSLYTFAQSDKRIANSKLGELESRREQEEVYFQMGLGLTEELRNGYAQLAATYADIPEVVDWAEYRLAEIDYSRDEFDQALQRLDRIFTRRKGSDIATEAQLLAAEILETPYNPRRNVEAADALLTRAEQENPGSSRAKVAALARRSTRNISDRQPQKAQEALNGKLNGQAFQSKGLFDSPIDKAFKAKHNEELAKAHRNYAYGLGGQGDYAGAYRSLGELVSAYTGDNPMNFFTYTQTMEDLEYQKALALAAQPFRKADAIAELKSFATNHPQSYLSLRAQAKIEQLDPKPVKRPEASPGKTPAPPASPSDACACGPSALKMALSGLGREVALTTLIQAAGTTDAGTTMAGLVSAARGQGVQAYGLRIAKNDLGRVKLPTVVLWYDHYVTVTAVSGTETTVYDPLTGWATKSPAEFNAMWEGALIVFAATEAEALTGLSGATILSDEEMAALSGRYLCGNASGWSTAMNPFPCVNYQPCGTSAEGELDGMVNTVNRVWGNNFVQTPPLVLKGSSTHIDLRISYNSQAVVDSDVGTGWRTSYSDRLTAVNGNLQWADGNGTKITFTRNVDGSFTAPPSIYDTLKQNPDGSVIISTRGLETLQFDATGRLVRKLDRNQEGVSLLYDAAGRISQIQDTNGLKTDFTYNAGGKIESISTGSGQSLQFAYSNSRLVRIGYPNPDGTTRDLNFGYSAGPLTTITNSFGQQTRFEYTTNSAVSAKVNAEGKRMTFTGGPLTNYAGQTTTYSYDGSYRVVAATDPLGYKVTYAYTPDNRLSSLTDELGNKTEYSYDANSNRVAATDALGNKTFYTQNERGQLSSVTDALGRTTTYDYDDQGNLLVLTDPLGHKLTYTYDAKGNVTSVTDMSGATTRFEYDSRGWLVRLFDAKNKMTQYGYNDQGYRTSVTDPLGNTTLYSYDFFGHVIRITYPDNATELMQYDGDRVVAKTDRRGNTTRYTYDSLGRVIQVTEPNGATTKYAYDAMGRTTAITDALGNVTSMTYDAKGRVTQTTYPGGLTETYTYDALHLIRKTEPSGAVTTYTYDALGRIIRTERK